MPNMLPICDVAGGIMGVKMPPDIFQPGSIWMPSMASDDTSPGSIIRPDMVPGRIVLDTAFWPVPQSRFRFSGERTFMGIHWVYAVYIAVSLLLSNTGKYW